MRDMGKYKGVFSLIIQLNYKTEGIYIGVTHW